MAKAVDIANERNNYRAHLITLVRACPLLWDKRELDFTNRTEKNLRWLEISKTLGVSTDKIRRTWENLRDQYRRDLKRQIKYGTVSKWRFFEDMQFIKSMVRCKEISTLNSGSDTEHDDNDPLSNMLSMHMAAPSSADLDSAQWHQESSRVEDAMLQAQVQQSEENKCDSSEEVRYEFDSHEPPDIVKIEIDSDSEDQVLPEIHVRASNELLEKATSEACVSTSATSTNNKRRRVDEMADTVTVSDVQTHNTPHQLQSCETQDEDYHFVMSILPALRQVQRSRKFPLRAKIMSMISTELDGDENS